LAAGLVFVPSLQAKPESGDGVVRFTYPDAAARSVYLVGDFNGWSPTATPLDREASGVWVAQVFMDPGTYEYKFYVDGEWRLDPDNPDRSETGNSVVRVGAAGNVIAVPRTSEGTSNSSDGGSALRWSMRYLGFFTWRRQPELGRWAFETPVHDVDLRLETTVGDEVTGWFLINFNTAEDDDETRTTLRYDRGLLLWRPREFEIRLFDRDGVTDFSDPGALIGKIGIYDDSFGFRRRGVHLRRRFFGAPLELLYADNREAERDSLVAAPPVSPPEAGSGESRYVALDRRRDSDTFALRFRAGTEASGVGFGYRMDRGAAPGLWSELDVQGDSLGLVASGRQMETRENWNGWSVDLRGERYGVHMVAEYMSGSRRAAVQRQRILENARYDSTTGRWSGGSVTGGGGDLLLDESRRAIVLLEAAETRRAWSPTLRYEYQENDFSALVTGQPFLMRRHSMGFRLHGRPWEIQAQLDLEQSWFEYPEGSTWETQFPFRKHNFWLDQSKADYQRYTWLGADRGSWLRLDLWRSLWRPRNLEAGLRLSLASPGFDRAPRSLETVVRLQIDLAEDLALKTHSRFSTLRRFETEDPDIVALLGEGKHVQAGLLAQGDIPGARYDYRTYGSHFLELVYSLTERSDVSLGFGVDPFVLYDVRNTYMDIGWEQFLFQAGASPEAALSDPLSLGERMEQAERELQVERRVMLEARIYF
jgi:hypothetical protein